MKQQDDPRPIYFISDAHIGSKDAEAEKKKEKYLTDFLYFLAEQDPAPILYIVGDLFDFWFEYRYAIPSLYQKMLSRIVYALDKGVEIIYVTGNHDFWMGPFFKNTLGIPIHHGIYEARHWQKRFFIFHGDGIPKEDRGYRFLKSVIQHPLTIWLYKLVHPDLGIPLARWASAQSRNHYKKTPEEEKADDLKYLHYAQTKLQEGYDFVIMGHTHRPVFEGTPERAYVNLGDWMRYFTYAVFREGQIELKSWIQESAASTFHMEPETARSVEK